MRCLKYEPTENTNVPLKTSADNCWFPGYNGTVNKMLFGRSAND